MSIANNNSTTLLPKQSQLLQFAHILTKNIFDIAKQGDDFNTEAENIEQQKQDNKEAVPFILSKEKYDSRKLA